jgi:hypothetical protein
MAATEYTNKVQSPWEKQQEVGVGKARWPFAPITKQAFNLTTNTAL